MDGEGPRHNPSPFADHFHRQTLGDALEIRKHFVYALLLGCLTSRADAAGIELLDSDPSLAGAIWYPCSGTPKDVPLGSLAVPLVDPLQAVKDCPVTGTELPLVIVSNGRGGWFGANHGVEEALVRPRLCSGRHQPSRRQRQRLVAAQQPLVWVFRQNSPPRETMSI
jgi:hypothetical protein